MEMSFDLSPTTSSLQSTGWFSSWSNKLDTFLTPSAETSKAFKQIGPVLQVMGAVNSAIGGYYAAQTAKYQAESQALTFQSQAMTAKHQQNISNMNARQAEFNAQDILMAGEKEIGRMTMRAGAAKASAKTSMAARGIQGGVGSAAEVIASMDIATEIDKITLNANTVRAASAARMQAAGFRGQALTQGASAENLLTSAAISRAGGEMISPWAAAGTSLMGSATSVMNSWYRDKSLAALLGK